MNIIVKKVQLIWYVYACFCVFLVVQNSFADTEYPKRGTGATPDQEKSIAQGASLDFASVKNPFEPKLPAVEKVKTPVEPPIKNADNMSSPSISTIDMGMMHKPAEQEVKINAVNFPQLSVKGIFCGTSRPLAIVDDRVVGINDMVKGARVKSIFKDKVRFVFMGEEFNVKMPE